MEICLFNPNQEQERVHGSLREFCNRHHLSEQVFFAADLSLEELLTNIFSYGFEKGQRHAAKVRLSFAGDQFQIEVEDDGRPFNPLNRPEVDTTVGLDDKPVGGLGIHLVRKLMDDLEYRRANGKNVLILRKRVSSGHQTGG